MVETVGLGGWAVHLHLDGLNPLVLDASDGGGGRGIVAIMADEDSIVGVIEALQRRLEHGRDDCGFVPRGHEDRDEAWVLVEDVIAG